MSPDREPTDAEPRLPTNREMAALYLTVRHLGRAQGSIGRARSPEPPRFGAAPEWLIAWADAEDALTTASNRLIDALESMPTEAGVARDVG